ncbi:MAG: sigma factor, partial [Pseudomonadota bacterium]
MFFLEQRKRRLRDYQNEILSYATALARDSELAQDLRQECAVRVLRAKDAPKEERSYKAWMFKILRNLWLDHLRRTGRQNET